MRCVLFADTLLRSAAGGRVELLSSRPRFSADWSSREYSLVSEQARGVLCEETANDRDVLAALGDDIALFVEQFEWVEPGAEGSGPHEQHELAVFLRQPGADRVIDDGADHFTVASGEPGRAVRSDVWAAWS